MRLAGIDGCPKGWVAALAPQDALDQASVHFVETGALQSFLEGEGVSLTVADIPIGFSDGPGPRSVEAAMRAFLVGKASSVFNTPSRAALGATTQAEASRINRASLSAVAKAGISAQSFGIFPKMREMDGVVRSLGQERVREGHPEVSFAILNSAPVLASKKTAEGEAARIALLQGAGLDVANLARTKRFLGAKRDDVLDALAMLWTATRLAGNKHKTFPPLPSRDAAGLEMSVIA